uniref:MICOS complex subunit MIC13 n=1 Tax=Ascaris lumbricoides TaxID=6252 RepID=A0A0M3HGT0_ASCLU
MTFDQQYGLLTQNLLVINRENAKTICELKRNWKFNAVQKSIKIGLGGIAFGYIVVGGITSVELGEILMVRLLPADPRSLYHPAINLDPQINQLETLIKQQPNELFIWPLSTIMFNNKGVYLPLAR